MKLAGTSHSARPPIRAAEQADRHHGGDVVDAAQRMHEAMDEAHAVMARMGECQGRGQSKRKRGDTQGGTVH